MQRFKLRLDVEIRQMGEYPPGSGNWQETGSNRLTVGHQVDLGVADFLQVAHILGQFHELAEKIKKEKDVDGKD